MCSYCQTTICKFLMWGKKIHAFHYIHTNDTLVYIDGGQDSIQNIILSLNTGTPHLML